uniref:Uncharacterized protein n=1 Tax=uncultured marine virus TaxID=186617 RepID=A0A0F7L4Q0_9VIRU|nr:hypothetical protein [uncultured marine virus]
MRLTEKQTISYIGDVVIGYKCDNCGKLHNGEELPINWHEFLVSKYSYSESEEVYVCSPECYISKIKKCVKNNNFEIGGFELDFAKLLIEIL